MGDGGLGPREHEPEIRCPVLVQRRRQADEDRVAVVECGGVGRRADPSRARQIPEAVGRDVLDVGATGGDRADPRLVDVEAHDIHLRLREGDRKG